MPITKVLRDSRRRDGLCPNCGRKRETPGIIACSRCRASCRRSQAKISRERHRGYERITRERYKQMGLCPRCGHTTNGFSRCDDCRKKDRDWYVARVIQRMESGTAR